jgi:hypothetical protein
MKRIYYASGSVLTGDAIAESVLAYARALAKSPLADIIHIPVIVTGQDHSGMASLLVGPASQLMCVDEATDGLIEPSDGALVMELERRSQLIGSPRPMSQHEEDDPALVDEYD